jgi:hypothetical protein
MVIGVVEFMFSCILIRLGVFSFRAQFYYEIIWEYFGNICVTAGFGVLRLFGAPY